jgi:hypothetical protein
MLHFALMATAASSLLGCSAIAGCGFDRWPVKDALDRDAGQINLTQQDTTIAALTALPAPQTPYYRYDKRYTPVETTVYRLSAIIRRISYLADDGDYHIIVADDAGRTMVVEAPDPAVRLAVYLAIRSPVSGLGSISVSARCRPNSTSRPWSWGSVFSTVSTM